MVDLQARKELQKEWVGSEPSIAQSDIKEVIDTEVLICGAGHSGLMAAIVAGKQGTKTIVLEKNKNTGVFKTYIGAVGSTPAQAVGDLGKVDKAEIVDELKHYGTRYTDEKHVYRSDVTRSKYQGANDVNEKLLNVWADESGATVDFLGKELAEYGYKHVFEYDNGDCRHGMFKIYPVHNKLVPPLTAGPMAHQHSGLYCVEKPMLKKAQKYGVQFMFETPLVKLVKEDGKVVGAIARKKDGTYIRINASKGVLLTTGGYADDDASYKKLNPEAESVTTFKFVTKGDTGDGIKAGVWAGAGQDPYPAAMLFDRGTVKPGTVGGQPYPTGVGVDAWQTGSQPFLKVDMDGRRFCNETVPYDYILYPVQDRKNRVYCIIWDRGFWKKIKAFHTVGCSRQVASKSRPKTYEGLTWLVAHFFVFQEMLIGRIKMSWSLEKLAKKLQLPPETFKASVERYNEMARRGVDEDFGKPQKDLIPVDKPPYFGVTCGGWVLCTMDGLDINENMQVTTENGEVIPGLYAAGDCAGGFFANNFYPELIVGIAGGKSLTFARHAILHMTGKLK